MGELITGATIALAAATLGGYGIHEVGKDFGWWGDHLSQRSDHPRLPPSKFEWYPVPSTTNDNVRRNDPSLVQRLVTTAPATMASKSKMTIKEVIESRPKRKATIAKARRKESVGGVSEGKRVARPSKRPETVTTTTNVGVRSPFVNRSVHGPRVTNLHDGTILVEHEELIGNVTTVASNVFTVNYSQPLNPGNSFIFKWLQRIGYNYEMFKFVTGTGMAYQSTCGSNQDGNVYMAFDYDLDDSNPNSKADILNYQGRVVASAYSLTRVFCPFNPGAANRVNKWPVELEGGYTLNNTPCKLYVATANAASALLIGEVYMVTRVLLFTPHYSPDIVHLYYQSTLDTSISATSPCIFTGVGQRTTRIDTLLGALTRSATGTATRFALTMPGYWKFEFTWTGTAITGPAYTNFTRTLDGGYAIAGNGTATCTFSQIILANTTTAPGTPAEFDISLTGATGTANCYFSAVFLGQQIPYQTPRRRPADESRLIKYIPIVLPDPPLVKFYDNSSETGASRTPPGSNATPSPSSPGLVPQVIAAATANPAPCCQHRV
jgi:hypothetical protein